MLLIPHGFLGFKKLITKNPYNQIFILLSATPQNELINIVSELKIKNCFDSIYGLPNSKVNMVNLIINKYKVKSKEVLMIGDAETDYNAAKINSVPFLFKKTSFNDNIIKKYNEKYIENFVEIF